MSRVGDLGGRLYRGEVSFNFVGRQRLWYTISGIILLVSYVYFKSAERVFADII